jgi:rhamnogalacturonan endolyase
MKALLHPILWSCALLAGVPFAAQPKPLMEHLDRGLVGMHESDGSVFLSWRLLADDPEEVAFHVYRRTVVREQTDWGIYASVVDPQPDDVRLNAAPIRDVTWFVDRAPHLQFDTLYYVRAVFDGVELEPGPPVRFAAGSEPRNYHSIPLQTPEGYQPNDASIGDLDGDGQFEIVVKMENRAQDNSRRGVTDPVQLHAYKLDGTLLWSINLGINIRAGAHYTQFMVYDFDGDGDAEVACRTADGTVDGLGDVIGDPDADHRNADGYVLKGPEWLTVFCGRTGAALDSQMYLPQRAPGNDNPSAEEMKAIWGDGYGNRMDRFLAGVAYLDGRHPSLIMARGYYTRSVVAAWDFRDGKLASRWVFDTDASPEWKAYAGQGNHQLSVADVDGDGRQEIIYGAMVINDDGTGLHNTGWGHGDALHVGDLAPSVPGIEIFTIQERFGAQGMSLRSGNSGKPLALVPSVKADADGMDKGEGPGRGNAFNIDPRWEGAEMWAAGAGMRGLYNAQGERVGDRPLDLPVNFGIYWDGDLLRELLDQNFIVKWNWQSHSVERLFTAHACTSNNGTKATPALSGDLWGDWREEVMFRTRDNRELRIFTSSHPTPHRMVTLLQDTQYRVALAWQHVAYNQPPHPSFYLDEAAPLPGWPAVEVVPLPSPAQ